MGGASIGGEGKGVGPKKGGLKKAPLRDFFLWGIYFEFVKFFCQNLGGNFLPTGPKKLLFFRLVLTGFQVFKKNFFPPLHLKKTHDFLQLNLVLGRKNQNAGGGGTGNFVPLGPNLAKK